jgi:hypothetical protein
MKAVFGAAVWVARMKKQKTNSTIDHVVKKTTIGNGRISTSTMNKHKRRSFKPYRGQGR